MCKLTMTMPWKTWETLSNAFENPHGPRLIAHGNTSGPPTVANRLQTLTNATTKKDHTQASSLARTPPSRTNFHEPPSSTHNVASSKSASCAHLSSFHALYLNDSQFMCFSLPFVPHSLCLCFQFVSSIVVRKATTCASQCGFSRGNKHFPS